MVLALAQVHHLALDVEQCKRFTAIFDDRHSGVIALEDFVSFSRFIITMSFLRSQEGAEVLRRVHDTHEDIAERPQIEPPEAAPGGEVPTSPAHLAVDCDFFKNKSEKLSAENADLRTRMHIMEDLMRKMETKLEEQEHRLRHAEVDLKGQRPPRR